MSSAVLHIQTNNCISFIVDLFMGIKSQMIHYCRHVFFLWLHLYAWWYRQINFVEDFSSECVHSECVTGIFQSVTDLRWMFCQNNQIPRDCRRRVKGNRELKGLFQAGLTPTNAYVSKSMSNRVWQSESNVLPRFMLTDCLQSYVL